jgi:hypothetical protein
VDRNKVAAGEICERLSTVQCAGEAACCTTPGRTFDACKTAMKAACVDGLYLDDISTNPIAGFDAARAEAAFTEFEHLASLCDPGVGAWGVTVDGLRGITQGTLESGSNCAPPDPTKPRAAAAYLAACKNPETTACLPTYLGFSCAARRDVGKQCFSDVNCVDGAYCDNPDFPTLPNGLCKQRKPDGQPCSKGNECASLSCFGSVCDQQKAYCLPK